MEITRYKQEAYKQFGCFDKREQFTGREEGNEADAEKGKMGKACKYMQYKGAVDVESG